MSRDFTFTGSNPEGTSSLSTVGTPRRESDPAPSTAAPHPPTAGAANPHVAAPATGSTRTRTCHRCHAVKPLAGFLHRDHPTASPRGTKFWCGGCLLAGRHVRKGDLDRALAADLAATRKAADTFRESEITLTLTRQGKSDRIVAAAILRAADELRGRV